MTDMSITERVFNQSGMMLEQKAYPGGTDLTEGISKLMSKVQALKDTENYQDAEAVQAGKKRLAPSKSKDEEEKKEPAGGVRRKAKEAEKKEKKQAAAVRSSVRLAKKASENPEEESKEEPPAPGCGSGFCEVMLAQNYDPEKHDPTGWLMSEKLDGVRCYWNGKDMYTRTGKPFYAPKSFTDRLPKMALDGELWTDRDDF